jgi:hypothetical protein
MYMKRSNLGKLKLDLKPYISKMQQKEVQNNHNKI